MQLTYPYRVNGLGRSEAPIDQNRHIRDLIEQVLFVTPGERVNRPNFGTGLMQFVFAGASDETIAAAQFLVQSALERELSGLITVDAVEVASEESKLNITVSYHVIQTQSQAVAQFTSVI